MTESLQLKANPVKTRTLYFNKYKYKLNIYDENLYYINRKYCDSFEEFVKFCDDYERLPFIRDPNYKKGKINHQLLQFVYKLSQNTEPKFLGTRKKFSVFTNDLESLAGIEQQNTRLELYEAIPASEGTIEFMNKPKHNYRVYLSGKRKEISEGVELAAYLEKNLNKLAPSRRLVHCLDRLEFRSARWGFYCDRSYYIDYDDDSTLMMLHLLFPGIMGRHYKLTQKITGISATSVILDDPIDDGKLLKDS